MGSRAFCPAGLSPARGRGQWAQPQLGGCSECVGAQREPIMGRGSSSTALTIPARATAGGAEGARGGGGMEGGEIASQGLALPLGKAALQLRPSLQWGHRHEGTPRAAAAPSLCGVAVGWGVRVASPRAGGASEGRCRLCRADVGNGPPASLAVLARQVGEPRGHGGRE